MSTHAYQWYVTKKTGHWQQHIHRITGKVLLLKDIHNLRATVNERQRDVSSVLSEHAASDPDDDVWLLIDDTSTVCQIFIQTAAMKQMFAIFPEVVMLDGTYSINNCGMPLYAFWCRMDTVMGSL